MRWLANLLNWFAGNGETAAPGTQRADQVRPATWEDVETVLGLLEKHGAEYVLVGGYALCANGLNRATGDVDVLVRNTPENNRRWIAALSELPDAAAAAMSGETDPFPVDSPEGEPGVIRIYDAFMIDVMPNACGLVYAELEPHIVQTGADGAWLNVLDLEGLLKTKQGVRAKDVGDRQQIELALARMRGRPTPSSDE